MTTQNKATDLEIEMLITNLRTSISLAFAERHHNLAEAKKYIEEGILRIRQLTGILEVRNMKRNS